MEDGSSLRPGFEDPVHEAQSVFRVCLDALSRPARPQTFDVSLDVPSPMYATSTAILLALADYETTIWLDAAGAARDEIASYLTFHTGARLAEGPDTADFALAVVPQGLPPLTAFHQGEPEYPDRSTTLILQVEELVAAGPVWEGPGIDGRTAFDARPMPSDWRAQLAKNRAAFPLGVDLILVTPNAVAGLPRSTREVTGGQ